MCIYIHIYIYIYRYIYIYISWYYVHIIVAQVHLHRWERTIFDDSIYWRNDHLCETLSGNSVPFITITSKPRTQAEKDAFCLYPLCIKS